MKKKFNKLMQNIKKTIFFILISIFALLSAYGAYTLVQDFKGSALSKLVYVPSDNDIEQMTVTLNKIFKLRSEPTL